MSALELKGTPDGPTRYVAEMGLEVGTFAQKAEKPCLSWHVPLDKRGDFRPRDLANYNPEKTYRTDEFGKVLCYGKTKSEKLCRRKALNLFPRCALHGGALHPLDEVLTEEVDPESLSRHAQFKAGIITVEDLDDEELAAGGFRSKNGTIVKPKNVPRDLVQGFQKAIYERAQNELKSHTVAAAKTLGRLATAPGIDDAIALRAAQDILDRNLGKAQQNVAMTIDAPWEEVFNAIGSGSREESRQARQVESSRPAIDSAIDAELVDIPGTDEQGSTPSSDDDKPKSESSIRTRLFERNEAILNPTIEAEDDPYELGEMDRQMKYEVGERDTYTFDDF